MDAVAREDSGRQGVMQFTNFGALIENVDHQCRGTEQGGLELLILRVVGTDRGDEGAGRHVACFEEGSVRGGTCHTDVAGAKGSAKIFCDFQTRAEPGSSTGCQSLRTG